MYRACLLKVTLFDKKLILFNLKVRLCKAHIDITYSVQLDRIKLFIHHSNKSILIYKNTKFFAATRFGVTYRHPQGTLQQD